MKNEYEEIRLEIVTIFQRGRTLNKIHCILHPYKFTADLEIIDMLSKAVKYIVLYWLAYLVEVWIWDKHNSILLPNQLVV